MTDQVLTEGGVPQTPEEHAAMQRILDEAMNNAKKDVRKLERQREKFKLHVVDTTKPLEVGDEMRGRWDGYFWTAQITQVKRNEAGECIGILASAPTRMGMFTEGPNRRKRRSEAVAKRRGVDV
jgi:hypothetical protein